MSNKNFYEAMESFQSFDQIPDDRHYQSVKDHWIVIVTDVKNSTEAIQSGHYRDVNKLGAASITVSREVLNGEEFPFVFGGDGASLVIHPDQFNQVKPKLLALRKLGKDQFDLDLRVGSVEVGKLRNDDVTLEVAKHELTPGRVVAIFRGGAMSLAENKIKSQTETFELRGEPSDSIELTGLSCRWKPIPSQRGKIHSILVKSRTSKPEKTYREMLEKFNNVLGQDWRRANPIKLSEMSYKSVQQCLRDEIRYHDSLLSPSFMARFFEILLAVSVFKLGINPLFFDPEEYANGLRTHSDYRKFDDMLRLTIDCTEDESEQIRNYLSTLYDNNRVFYGIHKSDQSLMTCYVENLDRGGHLHFIDGGNGGYARAAEQLKGQIMEETKQ